MSMTLDVSAAPAAVTDTDARLLERVEALKPLLREEALENERLKRIPARSLAAIKEAGVWKMMTPKYYGGYESSYRTVVDVLTTLVSGCPGIGWATALTMGHWIVARANDRLQDDIFGDNPGPVIPSVFGSFGARAKRLGDGAQIVGGGRWRFNSGCPHGDWDMLAAIIDEPDGSESRVWLAIPMSELEIFDDWHVSGARGTASMAVTCGDLFVPEHRILSQGDDIAGSSSKGQIASKRQADNPYYNVPTFLALNALMLALSSGTAKGALEVFLETLPGRKLTHTDYAKASEAPITHLQVGEAALKISAIEAIVTRHVNMTMNWKPGSADLTPLEIRALSAANSYTFKLAREAVDLLYLGSGSSVIREENPLQRYQRDIQAFAQHALMHPDTQIENLGRVLCGVPPFGGAARSIAQKTSA